MLAIMATTGKSKPCVWRWQERFKVEGVDVLLRDKTRPPGTPPLETTLVDKVVALTLEPPAQEATRWTVRAMDKGGRHRGLLRGENLARSRPGAALFSPGIWWIGSMMNLSGSDVRILAMYS